MEEEGSGRGDSCSELTYAYVYICVHVTTYCMCVCVCVCVCVFYSRTHSYCSYAASAERPDVRVLHCGHVDDLYEVPCCKGHHIPVQCNQVGAFVALIAKGVTGLNQG